MLRKIYHFFTSEFFKRKFKKVKFFSGVFIDAKTNFYGKGSVGANSKICSCSIGNGTYIGKNCDLVQVKIGKFCSIGSFIRNTTGRHPTKIFVSTHPAFFSKGKAASFTFSEKQYFDELQYNSDNFLVTIGNDVWIGDNVIIMDGITIGDGAIIGSGSVVTKDIEPYSINVGVPAKKIRSRFNDEEISWLLKFKWWNRDFEWIKTNSKFFHDINYFIKNFKNEQGEEY